jgi:hypothetical protein
MFLRNRRNLRMALSDFNLGVFPEADFRSPRVCLNHLRLYLSVVISTLNFYCDAALNSLQSGQSGVTLAGNSLQTRWLVRTYGALTTLCGSSRIRLPSILSFLT